jgi:molybdate transport system permease protein
MEWGPLFLSIKLAACTTLILFLFCVPFSYVLTLLNPRLRSFIEAGSNLPLVLPPTVLGFYLLIFLSPTSALGEFLESTISLRLVFSFEGLVFASCIYSFPFMLQPILAGMQSLPRQIIELSYILGKGRFQTLLRVIIPMIKPHLVKASMMTFAHTIGEFGVVLMVGGNLPGVTRVASVSIYDHFEKMNYAQAHYTSLVLLVFSFTLLWFLTTLTASDQTRNAPKFS